MPASVSVSLTLSHPCPMLAIAGTLSSCFRVAVCWSADAIKQEAETYKQLLTPEFLQLHRMQAVLSNTHMFLGDK